VVTGYWVMEKYQTCNKARFTVALSFCGNAKYCDTFNGKYYFELRFEVLTAVNIKTIVLCDTTPSDLIER
jgi:hypothetical protein